MKLFGIRHKTKPLFAEASITGNDVVDFCNAYSCELSLGSDSPWLTKDESVVDNLLSGKDTPWYNSSLEHPSLGSVSREIGECEKFEVEVKLA